MQVSLPPNGGVVPVSTVVWSAHQPHRRSDEVTAEAVTVVEIRGALLRLRRATGLPVAFGGLVESGRPQVRISELSGTATAALRCLAVSSGSGLGGKAVALARPCAVADYSSSRHISHEYDVPVAAEGIRSVLAVPVVVRRRVRGVLYGALRSAQPLGDRALGAAVAVARDVEQTLVLRDEARDLLAAACTGPAKGAGAEAPGGSGDWEQVREAHAALRALAPRIADPVLRADLLAACGLLTAPRPADGPALAPRELDVLSWVAAGATNAAVAERLGLRPETVKGYLRSAMRKLGAHTRGEAVTAARRAGLLP
ncbi:response regulator transcription factor [Streptomyces hygroscopicus]|uniref:response regulator transcription factor n=1 Tax=Streptomyces sp. KHY 26 TaxID=3097359 RepID=UPI002555A05F|nr:helix-turn-helix transcriptional regulator [Streptomyces hygroscopicus]